MQQALQFIEPSELAKITDLQLLARIVVEGFMVGLHRSPQSGSSIEFAQYRPYTAGDDPRFVDWNLYARTDRLHIKQYQEETNVRCAVALDCSASMDYGSGAVTKFHYARMLAASLAMLLHHQKDAVGFISYHEGLRPYIPPRNNARHLRRILVELDNIQPGTTTETAKALEFLGGDASSEIHGCSYIRPSPSC